MKFALEVGGDKETHLLEYQFNEMWGSMVIKVDRQEVKRSVRWFGAPLRECHDLVLGQKEVFNIRIEKERRFPFGQKNRVFVNERLVKCFEGV